MSGQSRHGHIAWSRHPDERIAAKHGRPVQLDQSVEGLVEGGRVADSWDDFIDKAAKPSWKLSRALENQSRAPSANHCHALSRIFCRYAGVLLL
ncbi:hypothetical protein, partial [Pseudarthrobacter siccitolerans]|uniref:hypothetical protein n=1 Tax=Pseudarthrobacter siccitolerans TaxID=861266 RepID=UPI001F3306AD